MHDPLGLELLISGTIRGQLVRFEDPGQLPVGSVAGLAGVHVQPVVFDSWTAERNTLRIGVVVITPALVKDFVAAREKTIPSPELYGFCVMRCSAASVPAEL